MAHSLRLRLAFVLAAALVWGCEGGGGDKPPSVPGTVRKAIIVRPGGSVVSVKYYQWSVGLHGVGSWGEFTPAEPWPRFSKVETIVTTVANAVLRTGGVTENSSAAVADSIVVALFAGGSGSDHGTATTEAVLYDPATQSGTALEMGVARSSQTMTRLPGGRVLVAGGYAADVAGTPLASAEIFTLASQAFVPTGSMAVGRGSHAASALADGRVLVTGGLVLAGSGPATDFTSMTEIFDPAAGTFSDGPPLATGRAGHSQMTLDDGRVLVLGGNGLRSAEVYTPATNQFTPVEDMAERHGFGHVAVKLADGKVLVTGGDSTINIQPTATVELFDPATNQFTTVGQMTTARMQHFAVLQDDGTVLIGGGRGSDGSDLDTVEIFDPAANTFTPAANLPGPSSDQPGAFVTAPEGG
jgi:hypothetical protein